jgi:hypothetical protein
MLTEHSISHTSSIPRGEGYLLFTGYLQIVAGVLTILFSAITIVAAMLAGDASWINPVTVSQSFGSAEAGFFFKLITVYMAMQISFGWIFGILMVVGGVLSLRKNGRRFITTSAIINLFNFPHGTTVAILVLHGMSRPGISGAFDDK